MNVLHPMVVHLPIALVLVWPLVDGIGLWTKRPDVSRTALALLLLAVAASLAATATGQAAYDVAVDRGVDPELLDRHADDANLMPWILLLITAVRWFGTHKLGVKGHVAGIVLGCALWPFVIDVGGSGGSLVYEHAVGVEVVREASR
jgi:uncharacterized membrane protein